jgi:PRTRC genetic system protein E
MFTELMPLLRKRGLIFTISLVEGETIRATVLPQKSTETDNNAVTTPLAITGTAEELDRDLPQQLVEFVGAHLQLQTTLASAKAEMETAAKAAREDVRKKSSKPLTATTPSSSTILSAPATSESRQESEPSLFATPDQGQTPTAQTGGAV